MLCCVVGVLCCAVLWLWLWLCCSGFCVVVDFLVGLLEGRVEN